MQNPLAQWRKHLHEASTAPAAPVTTLETQKPSSIAQGASLNIENIHLQPFLVNGTKQTVEKKWEHYSKNNNKLNSNAIREQLGIYPLGALWNSGSFSKSDLAATLVLPC